MHAGYRLDGCGNAHALAFCECGSTFVLETVSGGSVCGNCHGLVTGRFPDIKVAVVLKTEPSILCVRCARAHPLAREWLGDSRYEGPSDYRKTA
jgi:hypothetical protein